MTNIKPSSHGIVVENKESGLRYASHDRNFDPKSERKVRDLKIGESVLSYGIKQPRPSFEPPSIDDPDAEVDEQTLQDGLDEDLNPEDNPDTIDGTEPLDGQQ